MPILPKILVTSAVGKTGLPLVLQLREKGVPVRAFVRRRDERSSRLEAAGAEVFEGNQYDVQDMRRAMTGIDRAYQCAPTAPNGLHFSAVFSAAAHEAAMDHVVVLGQWLTSANHPSLFTREVYVSELLARMSPTTTVTSVIPGWFADNYLMGWDMIRHLGVFAMPLGQGDEQKNAPPSNEDIAKVAAAALMHPEKYAGQQFRPTGPQLLSPNDMARIMGQVLGRRVRYMDVSEKMMTKALRANPPANYSEAAVSQLAIYAEEYRRGSFAVNAPTQDVERLTGQSPDTFEDVVRRTAARHAQKNSSLGNRLRAAGQFAKMLMTPALDLDRIQAKRDYVRIASPAFSQDNAEWMASHAAHKPPVDARRSAAAQGSM